MKILAIFDGRKGQTSEYFAKTALKGAIEEGAEVQLINLRDLNLQPCTGCGYCHMDRFQGGRGGCVLNDDMAWLDEQYLECDGMLVVSPCYESSPSSGIKLFCDRLGPSHDVVLLKDAHDKLMEAGKEGMDERWFKERPCAFISHGGSEWTTLGLPILQIIAVPLNLKVIDKLNFSYNYYSILQDETERRVKQLGKNLVKNCNIPHAEMEYLGEEGHCPICHNTTMVVGKRIHEITCAVCGIQGKLQVENGEIKVVFAEEEQKRSHVTWTGKEYHCSDMQGKGVFQMQLTKEEKEKVGALIRKNALDKEIICSKP